MASLSILLLCLFTSRGLARSSVQDFQRRAPETSVNASSKAGLAWANGNFNNHRQYTFTGRVSWYYTWATFPINADIEFVPMLWGQQQASAFSSSIDRTIARNRVTTVLGMNEPQQDDQANMSPELGASLWRTHLEPLKSQDIRLGSPAPSSAPSGKTWLQDWLAICAGGCNPDFIALHWYGTNASWFQAYLEDFHDTFQLPIWVTEWACQDFNNGPQCSLEQVVEFLNQTQSFMDRTDWVERYAWFGVMENLQGVNEDNAMMDKQGRITSLGEQYIGAAPGAAAEFSAATSKVDGLSVLCLANILWLSLSLVLS